MNNLNSYSQFLDRARQVDIADINTENWEAQIQQGKYYRYYREASPGIYVLDFTKQAYLYVNEIMASFADRPMPDIMSGGLNLTLKLWHPDDLRIYDKYILPDNMSFLQKISVADYGSFLFTCNYRVRQRNGKYIRIEQSSFFSKSLDDGMPLMTIGFLRDITNRMLDDRIIHTIEKVGANGNELRHRRVHGLTTTALSLTLRELEILELLIKGKNSMEIAASLGIEKNTVDNHRKNMLRKTGSKNMVQLAINVYKQLDYISAKDKMADSDNLAINLQ